MRLLILLILVPLVEIGLFIQVGGYIGLFPTLFVVVATAALGAFLIRQQGMHVLAQVRNSVAEGSDPSSALLHGFLIFVAALLLLTPGFLTDSAGFALLFPKGREAVIRIGKASIVSNAGAFADFRWTSNVDPDGPVIEGTARAVDPEEEGDLR